MDDIYVGIAFCLEFLDEYLSWGWDLVDFQLTILLFSAVVIIERRAHAHALLCMLELLNIHL